MTSIDWIKLESIDQLDSIVKSSFEQPVLIYKHSIRCGLSSVVCSRLERAWKEDPLPIEPFFLDLVTDRSVSNAVSDLFQVVHESPQILLVVDGHSVFNVSHLGVSHQAIKEAINKSRIVEH